MARASDILVIGAGIVGCAVAAELARRGASVSVLDARAAGEGATQASGGMLAPYTEAAEGGPLLPLCARGLALFDDVVREIETESGLSVGYERSGTLQVAHSEASAAHFDALHRELEAIQVPTERLDAAHTRALEPGLATGVVAGLLLPTQGLVSAPAMTRAMELAATRRGAVLLEPASARRITADGTGVRVETDSACLHAGAVVLATGAWSSHVAVEGAETIPVKPIRGQLLHLGWSGPRLARITWDERCYLVPWRDGTLLVGATVEDVGFDQRTTVAGVRTLMDAVCALVPGACNAQLLSARAGLRPGSPDGLPIIGWSQAVPGLMYATGHYRNGVLLAPLTAQLVADAMLGDTLDPALAVTSPARFGRL